MNSIPPSTSTRAARRYRLSPPAKPFAVANAREGADRIHVPGSKSLTNRALVLAALAAGTSTLDNVLFSDDTRCMIQALKALGFDVDDDETQRRVTIQGESGRIPGRSDGQPITLHLGNAGTAMRFLTAACCLGEGVYELDGIERMRQRPIGQLVEALRQLGARIEYLGEEGYPPLRVHGGGITGGEVTFPQAVSSQYISALLMIGACLQDGLTFRSNVPLTSWPYVDMTMHVMAGFNPGVRPYWKGKETHIRLPPHPYQGRDYTIEPDASNANYFLAAAALYPAARCRIYDLGINAIQGDAAFVYAVLETMGAVSDTEDDYLQVTGSDRLKAIDVNLTDMPDMAQTLAVLALFAEGKTTMRGISNLRVKETDRIHAIKTELEKLGARVELHQADEPDGKGGHFAADDMTITPPANNELIHAQGDGRPVSEQNPVVIETYDDHRMAMSFALAGLKQSGIEIDDPACVNKTFPDFFDELARLGAGVAAVAPA